VEVPFSSRLALVRHRDEVGYRLVEKLFPEEEARAGRWHPKREDDRPGDVLSSEKAERAIRFLLGLEPVRAASLWPRRA
jgi:hypothetical protein